MLYHSLLHEVPHERGEEQEAREDEDYQEAGDGIPDLESQGEDRRERQGCQQDIGPSTQFLGLVQPVLLWVGPLGGPQPYPHQRHGHDASDREYNAALSIGQVAHFVVVGWPIC